MNDACPPTAPAAATPSRHWRRAAHATLLLPALWFALVAHQVMSVPAPAPLVRTAEQSFGMDVQERRALFLLMASMAPEWRRKAKARFKGDPWSQQDDFFAQAHLYLLDLGKRRGLHASQLHLVWDEGIRRHWRPAGEHPIPATLLPLKPRTQ